MPNGKFLRQQLFDPRQHTLAFIQMHVRHPRVAGHRHFAPAQRPDVHVVHFHHSVHFQNCARHFFNAHFLRPPLQQDVRRIPQNPDARPQHQHSDRQAQHRIDPVPPGRANHNRADNNRHIRERVAKVVHQNAAQI